MSFDLQVVKSRQVISPQNVSVVPGVVPTVLDITGANLNRVTEVRINDVISPDVIVVSSRKILAQTPTNLVDTALIRTVELLTSVPATTDPVKLFFELGASPVTIEGIQKLVQLIIKILLTTPGRDLYDPFLGGGFLSQIGKNISSNNTTSLMTDLTVGLSRTQSQIIEAQSQDISIPDSERLLSLDVVDAVIDPASASVFVAIRVQSVAGEQAVTNLFV